MNDMVKAIAFPVSGEPRVVDVVDDLDSWQRAVGGYIEMVTLFRDGDELVALLCNEEGIALGLPVNPHQGVFGRILGDYYVVRVDAEGANTDVRESDVVRFLQGGVGR